MNEGDSIDDPRIANLANPVGETTISGMKIDLVRFAKAANKLGADKHDVLSIRGYVNAKGEKVPDYDSIKIEKKDTRHG